MDESILPGRNVDNAPFKSDVGKKVGIGSFGSIEKKVFVVESLGVKVSAVCISGVRNREGTVIKDKGNGEGPRVLWRCGLKFLTLFDKRSGSERRLRFLGACSRGERSETTREGEFRLMVSM